ncbi:minor tail protein [Arthrobacter phage Kaylissa]|uniref:Minor tail protein n=1 Tax=Arthrobacter phage Kaylissa TaxID=2835951 RepID=A0AA92RV37_9CAUD|nr:minor tail protein [Arthrobacter phage Kaylissa]QXO14552.1 minor tail protein [Arthrobacter phage Kaylissa]
MSWDSVPWFVGGGAEHSPEVARLLAYSAVGGAEGLVTAEDLKVSPLAVPGGGVQIAPGAALIRNRAAGGDLQTYVARLPETDTVTIAATGSGAGRTDLIVAQIEDPYMAGEPWQEPVDPKVGPYVYTRVIPNVPAGTKRLQDVPGYSGRSAITLARVTLPASTGTVTAGMITDLRALARPRTERRMTTVFPAGARTAGNKLPTSGYASWPLTSAQRPAVQIPEWATRIDIVVHLSGVLFLKGTAADTVAGVRTVFGSTTPAENGILIQDAVDTDGRYTYTIIGSHAIPKALRGTTQYIEPQAVRTYGTGNWYADYQSCIVVDWQFSEEAA